MNCGSVDLRQYKALGLSETSVTISEQINTYSRFKHSAKGICRAYLQQAAAHRQTYDELTAMANLPRDFDRRPAPANVYVTRSIENQKLLQILRQQLKNSRWKKRFQLEWTMHKFAETLKRNAAGS